MYGVDSYQEPFWAKSGNFVRGRDPLGIQNSSIATYATLLPGMTNLTLRLRYYGLYLWLLNEYHKLPENHNLKQSVTGQYTFVRRAELIVAFLMENNHPLELAVIGSTYAREHKEEVTEKGYYDIAKGADKLKESIKGSLYWDYTSGALGQYYLGSLINLNLVTVKEGYFERTETNGVDLAEAYDASLSNDTKRVLLERIIEGKLYTTDLEMIDAIALNKTLKGTVEGDFYKNLLVQADSIHAQASFQRKESLQLFLSLLQQEDQDWQTMPLICYNNCKSIALENVTEAEIGWYFYQVNEIVHYGLETIFWALLNTMDGNSFSYNNFIKHVTQLVYSEVKNQFEFNAKDSIVVADSVLFDNGIDTEFLIGKINEVVKTGDSKEGLLYGMLLLISAFNENQHQLEVLKNYAANHQLNTKHGNIVEVTRQYGLDNKAWSFEVFVKKTMQRLLNEHTSVAYAKMGQGEKNLLKFIVEDNFLIHIETMQPNFTNPRLKTLYNFTKDLSFIDNDGKLTMEGRDMLHQITAA